MVNADELGKALPAEAMVIVSIAEGAVQLLADDATTSETQWFLLISTILIIAATFLIKLSANADQPLRELRGIRQNEKDERRSIKFGTNFSFP